MSTQISDYIAVLGTIDAVDGATSAVTSDWVDAAKYPFIAAYITLGAVGGVLNAKLQQATDSSGTAAKAILGSAGPKITVLGSNDDNKQLIINLDTGDLDTDGGFTFVACIITPATGNNLFSCMLLGSMGNFAPVLGHDISTMEEIVNAHDANE